LALVAFVAYGSLEFVREGVRKPFIIEGFMYSTGVTTGAAEGLDRRAAASLVRQRGVLAAAPWALPQGQTPADLDPVARGRAVYKAACQPCHAVDGYNAVRPLVRTWSRADLENLLDRMSRRRPMMPPFPGTADEKSALAAYLESLGNEGRR
jgi:mono/diheme cytochrome c family protein